MTTSLHTGRSIPARRVTAVSIFGLLLASVTYDAKAQGTVEDYARSEALSERLDGTVIGDVDAISWNGASDAVWYRRTVSGGHDFVLVDLTSLDKRPAFDHAGLADALDEVMEEPVSAVTLPFQSFDYLDPATIEFTTVPLRTNMPPPFSPATFP